MLLAARLDSSAKKREHTTRRHSTRRGFAELCRAAAECVPDISPIPRGTRVQPGWNAAGPSIATQRPPSKPNSEQATRGSSSLAVFRSNGWQWVTQSAIHDIGIEHSGALPALGRARGALISFVLSRLSAHRIALTTTFDAQGQWKQFALGERRRRRRQGRQTCRRLWHLAAIANAHPASDRSVNLCPPARVGARFFCS